MTVGKPAPNQPDSERVAKWRAQMTEAVSEVQKLVHARANYDRFAALVRSNDHVLRSESDFPVHVQNWFVIFATMAVRRIVEPNDSGDIISLRSVLDEMIRAARAFTSKEISGLFDAQDLPEYDDELRDFLISSMWGAVADPTSAQEQLNAKMLKDDRRMLDLVSRKVTEFVDKRVAHRTSSAKDYDLYYAEVSTCIDVIEAIALRYNAALLGSSMLTFVPTDISNWYDIFRQGWLYDCDDASS